MLLLRQALPADQRPLAHWQSALETANCDEGGGGKEQCSKLWLPPRERSMYRQQYIVSSSSPSAAGTAPAAALLPLCSTPATAAAAWRRGEGHQGRVIVLGQSEPSVTVLLGL